MKKLLLTKAEKEACKTLLGVMFTSGRYLTSKYLEKKVSKDVYFKVMYYLSIQELITVDILSVEKSLSILDALISGDEKRIEKSRNGIRYRISDRGKEVYKKL